MAAGLPIYLDYNATTPLDADVREAMLPFLDEVYGNPSSIHQVGRRARSALDEARDRAATVLGCQPGELVFTSGGTESNNLAILGAARARASKGRHLVTSAVEHHAVLRAFEYLARHEGFSLTILPVNAQGVIAPEDLRRALRPDTVLVSTMAANNETGALQPVAELGSICRDRGVAFHTDAVQWFGKEPFSTIHEFEADLVSICSHKFHGPKGAGVLFIRSPFQLTSVALGGSQENERRAGTENPAALAGLVRALELFLIRPVFREAPVTELRDRLVAAAEQIPGVALQGPRAARLANTAALTISGCDSLSLLAGLDLAGICASAGSACSAGSLTPSHVLLAMGLPPPAALSFIRFSLGRGTTASEITTVIQVLPEVVERIRAS